MPRRKTSSGGAGDEDEPAYLRKPLAEVAAALDDQIAKGRELLAPIDAHVLPAGGIDELSAQHSAWHNYSATYLERAFTSSALRREFEGVFIGGFGGPHSAMDRIRDLAYDLRGTSTSWWTSRDASRSMSRPRSTVCRHRHRRRRRLARIRLT